MLTKSEFIDRLKSAPDLDADSYDGSYELMCATIDEYASSGTQGLDHKDLLLVYTMAIGTWTQTVDFKRQAIDESHLTAESKDRLKLKLSQVWEATQSGRYEKPDIGMFGTGFHTFDKKGSKPTEDQVEHFISLCVGIRQLPDGDETIALDLAEKALGERINGFQAASASIVLHCLRPGTFPILNAMQGNGDPYAYMGIPLKKKTELSTYVENARQIKSFRDANFAFKNYRVIDLLASEVPPFNLDVLRSILTSYKERFKEVRKQPDSSEGEAFRWRALAGFRKNWDIDAEDFAGMLKNAFGADERAFLSYYNIGNMLFILTDYEPETMRGLFKKLASTEGDLVLRIIEFIKGCDEIHARHRAQEGDQSFQGTPAATVYLFLMDPEHNYPFREAAFDKIKKLLGYSCPAGRGPQKAKYYYGLADAICQAVLKEEELCSMSDKWADQAGLYNDVSRHALVDEIMYFAYKWMEDDVTDFSDWGPSLKAYNPGISAQGWSEMLGDPSVAYKNNLIALKCFKSFPEGATCAEVADKYGRTASFYNLAITDFARRVHEKTGCELSPRDGGGNRRWALPCLGKNAEAGQHGVFAWKLRPELLSALDDFDLSGIDEFATAYEEESMDSRLGENIILYGPPGTGKTYCVAAMAWLISQGRVATIDEINQLSDQELTSAKEWYDEQIRDTESGQVAFTTFHQSYGYEEFIEGIRPIVVDDEAEDTGSLRYGYEDGVFKRFCLRAAKPITVDKANDFGFNESPVVWKVSLAGTGDNPVRRECMDNGHIRIGWDEYGPEVSDETDFSIRGGKAVLTAFITRMRKGDIVLSCYSSTTIDAIGVVTGDPEWHDEYEGLKRQRNVSWIAKGIEFDIVDEFDLPVMTLSTVYRLKLGVSEVLQILENLGIGDNKMTLPNTKPYVFVIDEINRGNISKVFGELITLIEPTKRTGQHDQQVAILPYTKDLFSVPPNITIIGTMNTADRSIALMDTALRRRFRFIEMMPDYTVLDAAPEIEGIALSKMLRRMNERIAALYDREHMIGHAYFMSLIDNPSILELASVFRNRILPLLQEYFYDDYRKIRLVLADNQKTDASTQFIVAEQTVSSAELFGDDDIAFEDAKTYRVNDVALTNPDAYRGIYE